MENQQLGVECLDDIVGIYLAVKGLANQGCTILHPLSSMEISSNLMLWLVNPF